MYDRKFNYDTMIEARQILSAMMNSAREEREYHTYMRKKKDSYRYWLSWLFNNHIEIKCMTEDNINFVKSVVRNLLYTTLESVADIEDLIENSTFIDDIVTELELNFDEDFTNNDIEKAYHRVVKQKLYGNK